MELLPDQITSAPAIIAHHYTEAGLYERAAHHWLSAAELALSRSGVLEADWHDDNGLAVVRQMPEGQDRKSLELALLVAKANALLPLKGYSTPETVAVLGVAKHLLDDGVGDDLQRFSVLYGLCSAKYIASELESAHTQARQFVDLAHRQDNKIYRLVGHRLLGTVQFFMGRHREALDNLQRAERCRETAIQTVEVPLRLRSRPHTSRLQSNGAIYAWLSRPGSAGERSNAPGGRRSRSRSNRRALLFFHNDLA